MKKRILPMLVILLALAGGAAAVLFVRAVLSGWPAAQAVRVPTLTVVELDTAWADQLAACPSQQAMKDQIAATLGRVQALGGNAVALTGRTTAGEALFRDRTGTLAAADAITRSDRFLSRFDALNELIRQAAAAGVEVCLLATDDAGAPLPAARLGEAPAWLDALAARHGLRVLAAGEADGSLTRYTVRGEDAPVLRADSDPSALAMAVQTGAAEQVILGSYTALCADDSPAVLYNAFARGTLPDLAATRGGKTIGQTLAVSYPVSDGATVTGANLFLMGTSDPAAALTLNGEVVARGNDTGVWGVLVSLQVGANTFTLQNGAETLTWTVNRRKAGSSGGGALPADGSQPAQPGQYLVVTDAIASALQSRSNAGSIRETLYRGATAQVVASAQYSTGSKMSYAYQLATGDWVRSATCRLTDGQDAVLTAPQAAYDSVSRCTVLTFGGGTPALYHTWENNTLTLTFLSASFGQELPALPEFIAGASAQNNADGTCTLTLLFTESDPLYGWAVNYDTDAGTTAIWLKHTPRLSGDPAAPLAGVTVLLDAGHGGSDDGAMGAAGARAPVEKDLNLAAATAARHRLEQLGATVLMMREDDSFPTLGDRVTAANEQHPDFFIAIHHNSLELTSDINNAWGVEAYWFFDEGEALASALVENVCAATGRQNRGAKYGYYYVTRSNICPAVLLELGFMTNPTEYVECASDQSLWADGTAIAETVYRLVQANG